MESVFIVTEGAYSDYHIVAVFGTREEAEKFVNGADKSKSSAGFSSDIDVSEWSLGAPLDEEGIYQDTWRVYLDLDTGRLSEEQYFHSQNHQYERHPRDWSDGYIYMDKQACGQSVVSEAHALKVAAEARQEWLRSKVSR